MEDRNGAAAILFFVLVAVDAAAWIAIATGTAPAHASYTALDVGQGDATVLRLAGGVRIMADAGPDGKVVGSYEKAFPGAPRALDLAIVTHPELDHFNGFNAFLDQGYRIGAFVVTGRDHPGSQPWADLIRKIRERGIPLVTVAAGDRIRYGPDRIDILSPSPELISSAELNDTAIVEKVSTPEFSALLTADAGTNVEGLLLQKYSSSTLKADILKVGHHGSHYSSGSAFLAAIHPSVATVSVGAHNTYGHPSKEALERLAAARIPALRTDQRGNIAIWRENGGLKVSTAKREAFGSGRMGYNR